MQSTFATTQFEFVVFVSYIFSLYFIQWSTQQEFPLYQVHRSNC